MSNQTTCTIQEAADMCKSLEQLNAQCGVLTLIAENPETSSELKESIQQLNDRHKDVIETFNVSFEREKLKELNGIVQDAIKITQSIEPEAWVD